MGKVKKWLLRIVVALVIIVAVGTAIFWQDIKDIRGVLDYAALFEPETIVQNFRSLHQKYSTSVVRRSGPVFELATKPRDLPKTFVYNGETKMSPIGSSGPEQRAPGH